MAPLHSAAALPDWERIRVLIVEESPLLAMDMEAMLTAAGCGEVVSVCDGTSARTLLEQQNFDLAVIDCVVRNECSSDLAAFLDATSTPFAIWTGKTSREVSELFPLSLHLAKRCGVEAVRDAVDALLRRPAVVDPFAAASEGSEIVVGV